MKIRRKFCNRIGKEGNKGKEAVGRNLKKIFEGYLNSFLLILAWLGLATCCLD